MVAIEKTDVLGWEAAIRGMRNPMDSWQKSDTLMIAFAYCDDAKDMELAEMCGGFAPVIKANDMGLMQKLVKAGAEHSKFLRYINVTCDITAPLYWWKEFETYKVGTVSNSCSTMHMIHKSEITTKDFSCEDIQTVEGMRAFTSLVYALERLRMDYVTTKDKKYWRELIQLLPSSYNQKRTVQMNYAVLRNIYRQRKDHKLAEWHEFCDWVKTLPYAEELIING